MATPDDLYQSAGQLTALSELIRLSFDQLVAYHRPDVWQGGRARRFGEDLADRRVQVHAVAEQVAADARLLRARAELLRAATTPP
jgi:hypothetical protein